MAEQITTLNGTLAYNWRSGHWQWRDGTREPRVRTLDRQYFAPSFRCGTHGGVTCAEIPRGWERRYQWDRSEDIKAAVDQLIPEHGVAAEIYGEGYAEMADDHRVTVSGWVIPVEHCGEVMREPYGARWDKSDEEDILARAAQLS